MVDSCMSNAFNVPSYNNFNTSMKKLLCSMAPRISRIGEAAQNIALLCQGVGGRVLNLVVQG